MIIKPVERLSLVDLIFRQLRDSMLTGELGPGDELPAERVLSDRLEANRGAVREAPKRLEQARLVEIHQGETTRVLDFGTGVAVDPAGDARRWPRRPSSARPDGRILDGDRKNSGNIAYRLTLNTVTEVRRASPLFLAGAVRGQYRDLSHLDRIVQAIENGDAESAAQAAEERSKMMVAGIFANASSSGRISPSRASR